MRDAKPNKYPEFRFTDHGTIWLAEPLTNAADTHLRAHTNGTWINGSLAVEPRYVEDLVTGLQAAGFNVEGPAA